MIRTGIRPGFSVGFDFPWPRRGLRASLPFRRSAVAICILAAISIVMSLPVAAIVAQSAEAWRGAEDVFEVVFGIFTVAWLLGWSVGLFILYFILAILLFGREVLIVRPGSVVIRVDLLGFGIGGDYDPAVMRNLRMEVPQGKSGNSWRGPHLVFDYGAGDVPFGSNLYGSRAEELMQRIAEAAGRTIRKGAATPEELAEPQPGAAAKRIEKEDSEEVEPIGPPPTLRSPSTLVLIAANLVPVAGAAFLGWNLGEVMVLYWAESGVVAFYTLLKMWVIERWLAIPAGVFFLGHFGAFMAIHFLFVYAIFVVGIDSQSGMKLAEAGHMFRELAPAIAALFISHGVSYRANFLGRREYRGRTLKQQMMLPYNRVIAMHVALIFGGALVMALGNPAPVLLLLIAVKIWTDLKSHLKEHGNPVNGGRASEV